MNNNKIKYFYILIFILLITFIKNVSLYADDIIVGIETDSNFTTFTAQSYRGIWHILLYKTTASGTSVIKKEIQAGEDAVFMLIPKGIILRVASVEEANDGYDRATICGGDLLSIDFPTQNPIVCEGRLEITHDKKRFILTNTIPIKNCVISCASTEVMSCELEAVKAHIIALETKIRYLKKHSKHPDEPYDLCDKKWHCVNFKGVGSNKDLIELLYPTIKEHSIYYKNNLIYPRYHHTCGGKISSAQDIYGVENEPYHTSIIDIKDNKGSENCFHSPSFHWTFEIPLSSITDFLSIQFAGGASNIYVKYNPIKTNADGRITQIRMFGRKIKEISGIDFLEHLQYFYGHNSFKSMRFKYETLRRSMLIKGMGEGDGVGMCLYGADGLAKKGLNYNEILNFYYPGTTLK